MVYTKLGRSFWLICGESSYGGLLIKFYRDRLRLRRGRRF